MVVNQSISLQRHYCKTAAAIKHTHEIHWNTILMAVNQSISLQRHRNKTSANTDKIHYFQPP